MSALWNFWRHVFWRDVFFNSWIHTEIFPRERPIYTPNQAFANQSLRGLQPIGNGREMSVEWSSILMTGRQQVPDHCRPSLTLTDRPMTILGRPLQLVAHFIVRPVLDQSLTKMSVTATILGGPWSPMVFGGRRPFWLQLVSNLSYPQCN